MSPQPARPTPPPVTTPETAEDVPVARMSPSITRFAPAFVRVQMALRPVVKNANNPHFNNNFADLASVLEEALPILNANGFALLQFPTGDGGKLGLLSMLVHESGEFISAGMPLVPEKNNPQGEGSAITYGRRYAACAILGIRTADDDGEAASGREDRPTPARNPQPQPPAHAGPKAEGWASAEQEAAAHKEVAIRLAALPDDDVVRMTGRRHREEHGWPMSRTLLDQLRTMLDDAEAPGPTNPAPDPETPPPVVPAPESGDPQPLPAPDERTTALIAYVEGLKPGEIGDQLKERNAALSGTMDIRRSRLCKLLLAEGWQPEGDRLVSCSWCNVDFKPDDEIVEGMHEECRTERDAESRGELPPSLPL